MQIHLFEWVYIRSIMYFHRILFYENITSAVQEKRW